MDMEQNAEYTELLHISMRSYCTYPYAEQNAEYAPYPRGQPQYELQLVSIFMC